MYVKLASKKTAIVFSFLSWVRFFFREKATYQSLIFKRVVNAPEKQPEGPKVFESELQKVVC